MNYDLSIKEERKKFINRANSLLKSQRNNVQLVDESNRTLNQNSYIHVLCRIMANETGVTTDYAKQIYFKRMANNELFVRVTKDKITGNMITMLRSTTDLTISETRKAIDNFIHWAADNGYYLPEAKIEDNGEAVFHDKKAKDAFHQAEIMTSKVDEIN